MTELRPKLVALKNLRLEVEGLEIRTADKKALTSLIDQVIAKVRAGISIKDFWKKVDIVKVLARKAIGG